MLKRICDPFKHRPALAKNGAGSPIHLTCRSYTSNSLLKEINMKMFRVLDDSAARHHGTVKTVAKVLQLANHLRVNGVKLNSESYEHILSAYSKRNDSSKAYSLLKQMEGEGVKPSREYCQKALQLAAKAGDSTVQAKVLNTMEQYGYYKTIKTYHYMLLCMRQNLELERALETLEQMKEKNMVPGLLSYLSVIDMALHLHEPAVASELLEQAEKLDSFREEDKTLYMRLLRCAAVEGHYALVVSYWKKAVTDCQCSPDEGLCLYILDIAGKHKDPVLAGDVIRTIGDLGFNFRECHFAPLIDAFASTGDIASTFNVFSSMRKAGITPNKKLALPVAYKIGRDVNAIYKAQETLEDMSSRGEPVDVAVFNLVIHAFAFNRKCDEAISLYGQAKRLGVTPNSETLDATLDACIHCKDTELGASIYQEFVSKGIKPSATSLSKMVTLMCTNEDYEDAFTYLRRMKKLKMTPLRGCYFKLVKTLSRANDPRLATALEDMRAYGYAASTHMNEFMDKENEKRENLLELV
ncbi:hypothetical protein [Parasitella parasitica]|uniref:Uncharacterized protein n=1 Tax=Parasitella parasitica TaxID=35722 RepID=A0A0B7NLE6_9FUNG|nr:hypothetical protein [Parasitella parasitica]